MKDCSEFKEAISRYVDNELDSRTRECLEEHLGHCGLCKRELEETIRIRDLCRNLPEEPLPADFQDRLHSGLVAAKNELERSDKSIAYRNRWMKIGTSVAAVLLLAVFARGLWWNAFFPSIKNETAQYSMKNEAKGSSAEAAAAQPKQAGEQHQADRPAVSSTPGYTSRSGSGTGTNSGAKAPAMKTEKPSAAASIEAQADSNTKNGADSAASAAVMSADQSANPPVLQRNGEVTCTVEDPVAEADRIKALAEKSGAIPAVTVKAFSAMAAPAPDNDKSGAAAAAVSTDITLNYKIPASQYQQLITTLQAVYGEGTFAAGDVSTTDMTVRLADLENQLADIDGRLQAQNQNSGQENQQDIDRLNGEKDAVLAEIKQIRTDSDYISVTFLIRQKH